MTTANMDEHPALSVVIPCYNSAAFIGRTVAETLSALDGLSVELVLVDDRSPDGKTWDALVALQKQYGDALKLVRLLKNAGQHNAILAGFEYARGEIIVTMDDDLQHSPKDIPADEARV